ncbi:MAG: hypothetical protein IKE20_03145 [Eggerthellaceae bacterium]|nr:hypothetical protein [Eggerthellaceae bacterium]
MSKLGRPSLEQHVEIGQAIKDYRHALDRVMKLTCEGGQGFLYVKEQGKLCRLFNDGPLEMIKSRLEGVMFADHPWLTNDATSVYYQDDERADADELREKAKAAGMVERNWWGGMAKPGGRRYDENGDEI